MDDIQIPIGKTTNIIYAMEEFDSKQYEYWDKLKMKEALCSNGK